MRPIEILLSIANLLAFLVLAIRLPCTGRWMRHVAPIALLVAALQVLLEGPRWQMIPAYVLAGAVVPGLGAAQHFPDGWARRTPANPLACHWMRRRTERHRADGLERATDGASRVSLPASQRALWDRDGPTTGWMLGVRKSSAPIPRRVAS